MVPVHPGIGELDPVRERSTDRDRRLRLVRSVVAVVEPQPMPVHGGVEIGLIDHVDDELGALADAQRRAGNRAVVRQHADGRVADTFADGRDAQLDLVSMAEVDHLRADGLDEAGRVGREMVAGRDVSLVVLLHGFRLLPPPAPAAARERFGLHCRRPRPSPHCSAQPILLGMRSHMRLPSGRNCSSACVRRPGLRAGGTSVSTG